MAKIEYVYLLDFLIIYCNVELPNNEMSYKLHALTVRHTLLKIACSIISKMVNIINVTKNILYKLICCITK